MRMPPEKVGGVQSACRFASYSVRLMSSAMVWRRSKVVLILSLCLFVGLLLGVTVQKFQRDDETGVLNQRAQWKHQPVFKHKSHWHKPTKKPPAYGNTASDCPDGDSWGSFCAAWLSPDDRKKAENCLEMTENRFQLTPSQLAPYVPCPCRLLQKPLRGRVLLTSLPGSGNTWVRSMLERVTGVCTGSLWCDPQLRVRGMCGEGIRSPLLLVVKSHSHLIHWNVPREKGKDGGATPYADAVIFIHRDPFAATVSEQHRAASDKMNDGKHNLTSNMHVTHMGPEVFG